MSVSGSSSDTSHPIEINQSVSQQSINQSINLLESISVEISKGNYSSKYCCINCVCKLTRNVINPLKPSGNYNYTYVPGILTVITL
jgi:hypothetical protein